MYKPYQVANQFVINSQKDGKELTPMKLIKLCFIAHGWHLGFFDTQLLSESVKAWKYGPVIESIYHDFKKYGNNQITEGAYKDGNFPVPEDFDTCTFLNGIWDMYKDYTGLQLSTITHEPGSPWDITWNKNNGKSKTSVIIPNDIIGRYYKDKINQSKKASVNA